jgi:hypothetical protein
LCAVESIGRLRDRRQRFRSRTDRRRLIGSKDGETAYLITYISCSYSLLLLFILFFRSPCPNIVIREKKLHVLQCLSKSKCCMSS